MKIYGILALAAIVLIIFYISWDIRNRGKRRDGKWQSGKF